jgi:putative membrane protein
MAALLTCVVCALVGAAVASLLACIPGLHVYNVLALTALAFQAWSGGGWLTGEAFTALTVAMTVGYAMLNTVPSVFLAAPDESALFTVLPGQKYLMAGRGREAVLITAAGGAVGLFAICLVLAPLGPRLLPVIWTVLRPHAHWVLWCVIAFMLMSEWPRSVAIGVPGWRRFLAAWRNLGVGLLTFLLSGLLGFLLLYRSPIPPEFAFQNLLPAFAGLFTLPWLLLNLAVRATPLPQRADRGAPLDVPTLLHGGLAGVLGGGFAAFIPVVTGGVGGFLAGHATAIRNDRMFLVSQGAAKVVYYVAGLLLFFMPGLHVARGGAAAMLMTFGVPQDRAAWFLSLAAAALAGAVACALVSPLTSLTIAAVARCGYRRLSWASLALILAVVLAATGGRGLTVAVVAAGIGLLPVLFGSRRMNCLGVILLPMACNLSGFGPAVARALGLL